MKAGSANFENLATNSVAMATFLQRSQNECLIEPSRTSTNPENLVKIGPVDYNITA